MSRPAEARLSSEVAPGANYIGVGEPPHCTDMCNVVIFGDVGAGKSSLVNLISRTNTAVISPDAGGCTTETNAHEILIQNETLKVKLFDTPGLDAMVPTLFRQASIVRLLLAYPLGFMKYRFNG